MADKPDRIAYGSLDQAATLAQEIITRIKPSLAGQPPEIQGAVLADLLAMWLAGHYLNGDTVIQEVLRMHIETVQRLIPVNIRILKERPGGKH